MKLRTPARFFPILLLVIFAAPALVGCGKTLYTNLDSKQLQAKLKEGGTPLYDVRRPEEWRQTGVVPGSRTLTFVDASGRLVPGFLEKFTASVQKNEPVIIICRTGSRTAYLARYLTEKLGYTKVYNVRYGITDWIRGGHAVSRL